MLMLCTHETKRVFIVDKWDVCQKSRKEDGQDVDIFDRRIRNDWSYDQVTANDDDNYWYNDRNL